MKKYCVFLGLLLFVLGSQGQASTENNSLYFALKVQDVTVGEIPFGAASLFELIIKNSGSEPVQLATSTVSPWMVFSGFWKVHISGPVVAKCKDYISYGVDEPGIGEVPCVVIPAKSKKRFQLYIVGVAEPGVYQVWVEYRGTQVPYPNCYTGVIRSKEYTFEVKEPQGVDAEILQLWQKQNPDKPVCYFPLEMEPNILQPSTLLSHFPTSTYAVWVVLPYLGKPDKADPSKIFELVEKGTYPMWNGIPDPETKKWKGMKGKELAEYQNKWINTILNNHPDFAYALRLRLTFAINHIVLGDAQEGKNMLRDLAKGTDKEINGWAQQFLQLIEKKETPTKKKLFYSTD